MKLKMSTKSLTAKKFLLLTAATVMTYFSYAQPANDACSGAISIVPSATATCTPVSGSTVASTMSTTESGCSSVATGDVWYSFVATGSTYQIKLDNVSATNPNVAAFSSFGVALYSGACASLVEEGCEFGYLSYVFGNSPAQFTASGLNSGATYYVQVWADEAADTAFDPALSDYTFDLCIALPPPPPANDFCSGATLLAQGVTVTGDNSTATNDVLTGSPTCGSASSGLYKGVWYTATPTASGNLTIESCGSSFDTYLKVFSGGSCSAFTTCNGSDDDGCSSQSTVTFAATAGTTYYILLAGYGDGDAGAFTIAATGVALPVTMDALSGKIIAGGRAQLSWTTFTEQNNKGFEIQRSTDGKTFIPAGFVGSKAERGNSNGKIAYTFVDPSPVTGAAFYRLQQTDIDGKNDYSNIIRLSMEGSTAFELVATPNPVSNNLSIKTYGTTAANARITVTDMGGKVIQQIAVTAATTDIDMSTLANGIYILKYTDANRSQVLKISKQ